METGTDVAQKKKLQTADEVQSFSMLTPGCRRMLVCATIILGQPRAEDKEPFYGTKGSNGMTDFGLI